MTAAIRASLLKYLERRIPRYTSYPTAAQFGPGVDAGTYEAWLAALDADIPVSIYFHVPFCTELCLYCGCQTTVARHYAPIAAYVDALEREIDLVGRIAGQHKTLHVHWGGGTPTMLAPQDFMRLMSALRTHFTLEPEVEMAIEIDPRRLTREYVTTLGDAGISRASLGVQDFEPRVQAAVGRVQSFEETARAIEWLRGAGIAGINLDLMYGLPFQTVATVEATAQQAIALNPERIALFGYAHVPWMKRHQRLIPERELPRPAERFAQNRSTADVLTGAGYQSVGLDHFAKSSDLLACRQREGRLHRNFQGYTTDESPVLIGFGASAIGALPEGYVQNAASTAAYRDAISGQRLAIVRGRALTEEDRLRREIIERLMCDLKVDLAQICEVHGKRLADFAAELSHLDELASDGLVQHFGGKITVPESARALLRTVCAVFDRYLPECEARYSTAS